MKMIRVEMNLPKNGALPLKRDPVALEVGYFKTHEDLARGCRPRGLKARVVKPGNDDDKKTDGGNDGLKGRDRVPASVREEIDAWAATIYYR